MFENVNRTDHKSIRLYIGGLSRDVDSKELYKRLISVIQNADCTLKDIEFIMERQPRQKYNRGFAYVTIDGENASTAANNIIKCYHKTKWRGSILRVEIAQPHYKLQLQMEWLSRHEAIQERQEVAEKYRQSMLHCKTKENFKELNLAMTFKGKKKSFQENSEDTDIDASSWEVESLVKSEDESIQSSRTSPSEQDSSEDEMKEESNGEMSSTEHESVHEEERSSDDGASTESSSVEDELRDPGDDRSVDAHKQAAHEKDSSVKLDNSNNIHNQEQSVPAIFTPEEQNARRIAALQSKMMKREQNNSGTLNIDMAAKGTKVRFDDSEDDEQNEDTEESEDPKSTAITDWLDSSDEETEETKLLDFQSQSATNGGSDAFAFRPEFSGEQGKELFELQKRFGGDQRFRLDSRFREDFDMGNEFGGNDVTELEVDSTNESSNIQTDIQQFRLEPELDQIQQEIEEMRAEEDMALHVIEMLFPDLDVERIRQRLRVKESKDPIKNASWMGNMPRYDPRNENSRTQYELAFPVNPVSKTKNKEQTTSEIEHRNIRKEIEEKSGGDRFFTASKTLGSMFTRVRKNSEDGMEGEAALDGVFSRKNTEENKYERNQNTFKLTSLFDFAVDEGEKIISLGEQIFGDDDGNASPHTFGQWQDAYKDDNLEDNGETDGEEEQQENEEMEENPSNQTIKRKSIEELLSFGRQFVAKYGPEGPANWAEQRKLLTQDFKRKRKEALRQRKKKRQYINKSGEYANKKALE